MYLLRLASLILMVLPLGCEVESSVTQNESSQSKPAQEQPAQKVRGSQEASEVQPKANANNGSPEQVASNSLPPLPITTSQSAVPSGLPPERMQPSTENRPGVVEIEFDDVNLDEMEDGEDSDDGRLENEYIDEQGNRVPIEKTFSIDPTWTKLGKMDLWIDRKTKTVYVGGYICLRAGMLEMFACPQHTKEHESVVASLVTSKFVHAALLAVGAKPGKGVQWDPDFKPATGPVIDIEVHWMEDGKLIKRDAKEMIRNIDTRKQMEVEWLFAGSESWVDPDSGRTIYYGDAGELVCLSNFSTATIDIAMESSSDASNLLFEANPEKIPPLGTSVLLVLKPKIANVDSSGVNPDNNVGQEEKMESDSLEEKTPAGGNPDKALPDADASDK